MEHRLPSLLLHLDVSQLHKLDQMDIGLNIILQLLLATPLLPKRLPNNQLRRRVPRSTSVVNSDHQLQQPRPTPSKNHLPIRTRASHMNQNRQTQLQLCLLRLLHRSRTYRFMGIFRIQGQENHSKIHRSGVELKRDRLPLHQLHLQQHHIK